MSKSFLSFISWTGLVVILTACGAGSGTEGESSTAGASSDPITLSSEPAVSEITYVAESAEASMDASESSAAAPSFSAAITGKAQIAASITVMPIQIEAENYTSMYGVQNESSSDLGGGQNVGYIETGDWMAYNNANFNVPVEGRYKVTYRVASLSGGGRLALKNLNDVSLNSVDVPKTNGWQTWADLTQEVRLASGNHNFKIVAEIGGFNINWFKLELIECVIQAENFTSMYGIQNEVSSDLGGGHNVGYIETGDWMAYNNVNFNVPAEGLYKITYRVASLSGGGRLALKNLSDISLNSVDVPRTNGWQTWVDVIQEIRLASGNHNFKIVAEFGGFNINWFKLERINSGSSSSASSVSSVNPQSSSSRSSSLSSRSSSFSSRSSSSSSRSSSISWSSSISSSSRSSSVSSSSRSSSVSSSSRSSLSSSSRSSSVSSSRSSSIAARTVTIEWSHPTERENGEYLELNDIGGYEIRVSNPVTATSFSVGITGNSTTSYQLANYVSDMTIEIAVYDSQGLYSQYVRVSN